MPRTPRPRYAPVDLGKKTFAGRFPRTVHYRVARKSGIIAKTGFRGYDKCLNTYVGCEFGCSYCYCRFFLRDPKLPWGSFVRVRLHIESRLTKELPDLAGLRVVMGTMSDPYQPSERKHRVTRTALEILAGGKLEKLGIFTRSPLVKDDLDLIKTLPRARIHFTIPPFPQDFRKQVEPVAIPWHKRFEILQKIKDAGIYTSCNVAPAMPYVSEDLTEEFAQRLADVGVDEFFVDPMQGYKAAMEAMDKTVTDKALLGRMWGIMLDKEKYQTWKNNYRDRWFAAWAKVKTNNTLPVWSDHENDVWVDMNTGKQMNQKLYGDDLCQD